MEEYDATYDSEDEVDFSKMDMVRGERSAWFPEKQSGEMSSTFVWSCLTFIVVQA